MSAFLLYSKAERSATSSIISPRMMGEMWQASSKAERLPFEQEASRLCAATLSKDDAQNIAKVLVKRALRKGLANTAPAEPERKRQRPPTAFCLYARYFLT